MREILFRGKRRDSGKWIHGSLVKFDDDYVFIMPPYEQASTMSCAELFLLNAEPVIPDTVGQYTGLKDKNNQGIFEGDILKFPGAECDFGALPPDFMSVTWEDGCWMLKCIKNGTEYLCEDSTYDAEVIGNIYDNPELLKGAES